MLGLLKKLLIPGIIGGVIFIGIGDSFLPKPLSTYSRNTRNTINAKMLGLMPPDQKVNTFKEKVKNKTDPRGGFDGSLNRAEKGEQ